MKNALFAFFNELIFVTDIKTYLFTCMSKFDIIRVF